MAPNKLLGATVLAAAALLGGCGQQDQAQSTEQVTLRGTPIEREEVVEEPPYEFEDIFPGGRRQLPDRGPRHHWTQYAGSVRITVPDPASSKDVEEETEMLLHVRIRDADHDYESRGWQENDLLNFRVDYSFDEIDITDFGVNLRCDERDFVKDEIYGGTFTSANRKSRKHCNSYMKAYAEKLVEALNEGQEWIY